MQRAMPNGRRATQRSLSILSGARRGGVSSELSIVSWTFASGDSVTAVMSFTKRPTCHCPRGTHVTPAEALSPSKRITTTRSVCSDECGEEVAQQVWGWPLHLFLIISSFHECL
ncbi:hypothetical protein PAXRUDRAFT_233616 [Paxillus rubicundulus Ve08.2h10]|uniref:Uncharacterized protein n=1 Tax=Paxillus rubicundulus Ve08.2h10 TaxID=930991 RepID=A0A0D0E6Y3_9AGAM|nr:hypothetical protein PAXRUDRAFT_233616 [Paxillus rubicundulus Ve08.2h10]